MKKKIKNIWYYIQGNVRKFLYYNFKILLPRHIIEQIEFRLKLTDKACYNQGFCEICGCNIPGLQMANKSCPKPCYPKIMDRLTWRLFYYSGETVTIKKDVWKLSRFKNNFNIEIWHNDKLIYHGKEL